MVKKNKTHKIYIIILAMIMLAGLLALLIANTEIGESIKEGLKAYTGREALVGIGETTNGNEDARIGDKAIISSAKITDRKTGTGPWDENDEPGNDSSAENDIVRSFDQVTWTIEATMSLKEDAGVDSITGGVINIEATLPEECANVMKWDLDSMIWLEGSGSVSEDGRTLTGSYTMSETTTTVPGKQNLELILQIYGAKNGTNIQPEIKIWIEGNTEEEKQTVDVENIVVSATEKFNVELRRNDLLYKEIDVDMDLETVRGRVYGYSLVYQLYNDEGIEKGLKGIQYPEANTMTLDVNLKLEKVNVNDASDVQNITETSTPILYNYDLNNSDSLDGNIPNRPMNISSASNYSVYAPRGKRTYSSQTACYDSGNVVIEQNGSQMQVTISEYKFDGQFPSYASSSSNEKYEENIGCFASIYFMIFVPYTEESIEEEYNYYLTVEDANLKEIDSVNVEKKIEQEVTIDDTVRHQHELTTSANFVKLHWLKSKLGEKFSSVGLFTHYEQGDSKAEKGQKFIYEMDIQSGSNNDLKDDIYDANVLMKFDGEAFNISEIDGKIWSDDFQEYNYSNTKMEFNMIYAAKPDGSNWIDDTEMQSAEEEDLLFYTSLEELKANLGEDAVCVGVLFESINGYQSYGVRQGLELVLQVTDKA